MKKIQQISPWSIYNKKSEYPLLNNTNQFQQTRDKLPKLPKIKSTKNISPQIKKRTNKERKLQQKLHELYKYKQKLLQFEEEENLQKELQQEQHKLLEVYDEKFILSVLYHHIKTSQMEENLLKLEEKRQKQSFQKLLEERRQKQRQKDKERKKQRQVQFKQVVLVHQPQQKLPKISAKNKGHRSCFISKCPIGMEDIKNGDQNIQMMNKFLKQKIENMISQKMKILNKKKTSIHDLANKPYNFY